MADSEYYIQIFLFVATILCYIVLAIFAFYGVYYCCVRACILKTKRKRQQNGEDNDANAEQQQPKTQSYFKRVESLNYPFYKDGKNVMIVPNSNTSKSTAKSERYVKVDNNTSDFVISNTLDERNPFIDKKYYDIFHA